MPLATIANGTYKVTVLVSDGSQSSAATDKNLVNSWGSRSIRTPSCGSPTSKI